MILADAHETKTKVLVKLRQLTPADQLHKLLKIDYLNTAVAFSELLISNAYTKMGLEEYQLL